MGGMCCCSRSKPRRSPSSPPLNLVICGASFGGIRLAQCFSRDPNVNVTVIEPKDFYEYTPGILRAYVEPQHTHSLLRDMKAIAASNGFQWVQGHAVEIRPREDPTSASQGVVVVQKTGEEDTLINLHYSVLVWAAGSSYTSPAKPGLKSLTKGLRLQEMQATAKAVESAQSVLVVGSGPVGVELVAEIKQRFPDKKVTIATNTRSLLANLPPQAGAAAEHWMRRRNVNIMKEIFIQNLPKDLIYSGQTSFEQNMRTLQTDKGALTVDTVFMCAGYKPIPPPLRGDDVLRAADGRNHMSTTVNNHLQAVGYNRVFVIGDAMAHPAITEKLAHTAELSALGVAKAISALSASAPVPEFPRSVTKSDSVPKVMVVSLGKYDGIVIFNRAVFSSYLFRKLGALLKTVIEVSKIWQTEGYRLAEKFWDFGDFMAIVTHRWVLRA